MILMRPHLSAREISQDLWSLHIKIIFELRLHLLHGLTINLRLRPRVFIPAEFVWLQTQVIYWYIRLIIASKQLSTRFRTD